MTHSPETLTALAHSWAGRLFPDSPGQADEATQTEYETWLEDDHGPLSPCDHDHREFDLWEKFVRQHGEFTSEQEIVAPKPITLKVATFSPEFMAELAEMGIEMEADEE